MQLNYLKFYTLNYPYSEVSQARESRATILFEILTECIITFHLTKYLFFFQNSLISETETSLNCQSSLTRRAFISRSRNLSPRMNS